MKLTKIIIVLIVPIMAEVGISCCHCSDPLIGHYTNKTFSVTNLDNRGSEVMVATAASVPKEAYGIRMQLGREKTVSIIPPKSFFIQTAYATSCRCPPPIQLEARDSMTDIHVVTLNDFGANHPAGSDVSDLFKVFKRYSFSTIPDFIRRYNTILVSDDELELTLDVLLMTPPDLNTSHSFKIIITLSDGRILQETTTPIDLI